MPTKPHSSAVSYWAMNSKGLSSSPRSHLATSLGNHMSSKSIRCGKCSGRHESVDLVRECHHALATPPALATKRGKPVRGDRLVLTTFTWEYACDICGKALLDREALHRPTPRNAVVGGWCQECGRANQFDDLLPVANDPGDPDEINSLYHFTDSRNLASIEKRGILSLAELVDLGLPVFMSSSEVSRQRDRAQRMAGLVRLALVSTPPDGVEGRFRPSEP